MTENDWTKLISIRIDKKVLQAIDAYELKHTAMGRSYYINLALRQLFINCSDEQIHDFLYTNRALFQK